MQNGKPRDDNGLLGKFDDLTNDGHLFIGWTDLATALGRMPIEAQAYQVWFFATRPQVLASDVDPRQFGDLFPSINEKSRREQKHMLGKAIRRAKRNESIMRDSRTERRKLILSNDLPIVKELFEKRE